LREAFTKVLRHRTGVQDFCALSDVSLEVHDGEVLGIIGRNGSGKSTLLKLIAGVYRPSSGSIQVNGSVAPLIELGAGFHADLTGRENIILNGLMLGLSKKEITKREAEIIEFAELGEFIDSPVKQYSSGMFMRLAFSIATEVDPDILLVDEILAVGDAEFREKCDARIRQFRKEAKTIIIVTHELDAIRELCNRVILLDHGQTVADGDTEQVVDQYRNLMHVPSAC
jgi:ABC-2 type transport system ATP-binding protein/lipopolysaccharide transport system ATP-binding protein